MIIFYSYEKQGDPECFRNYLSELQKDVDKRIYMLQQLEWFNSYKDGKYDGTILDPFHGSGTLGVCCEKLNKEGHNIRWIGIELEKKWSDICEERLKNVRGE